MRFIAGGENWAKQGLYAWLRHGINKAYIFQEKVRCPELKRFSELSHITTGFEEIFSGTHCYGMALASSIIRT